MARGERCHPTAHAGGLSWAGAAPTGTSAPETESAGDRSSDTGGEGVENTGPPRRVRSASHRAASYEAPAIEKSSSAAPRWREASAPGPHLVEIGARG